MGDFFQISLPPIRDMWYDLVAKLNTVGLNNNGDEVTGSLTKKMAFSLLTLCMST